MKYSKELHDNVRANLIKYEFYPCVNEEITALLDEIERLTAELALTEIKLCNIDRSAKAEIARRDDLIKRLVEDGERLADGLRDFDGSRGWRICKFCGNELEFVAHSPSCTITLHRALMKEVEG